MHACCVCCVEVVAAAVERRGRVETSALARVATTAIGARGGSPVSRVRVLAAPGGHLGCTRPLRRRHATLTPPSGAPVWVLPERQEAENHRGLETLPGDRGRESQISFALRRPCRASHVRRIACRRAAAPACTARREHAVRGRLLCVSTPHRPWHCWDMPGTHKAPCLVLAPSRRLGIAQSSLPTASCLLLPWLIAPHQRSAAHSRPPCRPVVLQPVAAP